MEEIKNTIQIRGDFTDPDTQKKIKETWMKTAH